MDPTTVRVREMYSRFPFPSNDRIENELPGYLPGFLKRLLSRRVKHRARVSRVIADHLSVQEKPWRYLDAGCGTGETFVEIARGLEDVELRAIDLSPTSVDKARRLLDREGVEGAVVREHDLMQPLPFADEYFSVISSLGVLHHLVDPVTGMRNVARCLRPDGFAVFYLYGRLGRQEQIWKREVVRLVAGEDADFDHKVRVVRALDLYPRRHRSRIKERIYRLLGFDRVSTRDIWIVDQLAHVQEREYDIPEIEADLDAAGLELVELHGFPNSLREYVDDEEIRADAERLSRAEQLRVLDLLIRPSGYWLSARRKPAS